MDWGDFAQPNIPAKYRRKGKPEFVYGFADGHVVSKDVNFGEGNWFPKPVMIGTDLDENKYFHYGHFKSAFDNAMQGDVSLDNAIRDGLDGQSRVRFETVAEFRNQRQRLGEALAILQPDVLAVQELENDGFGPRSAERFIIQAVTSPPNIPVRYRPSKTNPMAFSMFPSTKGACQPTAKQIQNHYHNDHRLTVFR